MEGGGAASSRVVRVHLDKLCLDPAVVLGANVDPQLRPTTRHVSCVTRRRTHSVSLSANGGSKAVVLVPMMAVCTCGNISDVDQTSKKSARPTGSL